jgi:UDP-glucose 4-epimerase
VRILVSGTHGFIGRRLLTLLVAHGHDVVALTRGPGGAPADLVDIGGWDGWPGGLDAVVHLGARNPSRRDPAARDLPGLTHVNADGSRALAQRAAAEGVRRFVFLSSANVHRPRGLTPVRESDELHPQSAYAASKLAAETALAGVAAETGLELCILRPTPVYGPGGRGMVARLVQLARTGLPLPLGQTSARRSVLALDNCLDAILAALTHPEAAGQTFLLADREPLSLGDMVAATRIGLGRSARLVPLPESALRRLAALVGRRAAFDRLFGSFVVDGGHIAAVLGWQPPLSSEEGFRRAAMAGVETAGGPRR